MTDKKQPKTKEQIREDLKQENFTKFIEEWKQLNEDLSKKYKWQVVPVLEYTKQGVFPVFGTQEVTEEKEATQDEK